ncbi:MAG TPA: CbbQ/NirQ/NorQ/GpvN family protein [Deltaproteobacteria bacterium]|nr:CbbQ/NirQ/NorQ/GpvN family protein [Deltaproteobacteria bacterium]
MNPVPWYRETGHECRVFEHAAANQLPLLLKGPTGCGKSRLVEHMAARLERPLVTVACHDDTAAPDLLGRWLIRGGETVWEDGPVTRAVRQGAVLYIDEIAEARPDVVVVLHPLTDHRRQLFLDRHDEVLAAPDSFVLVVSFNPGYQRGIKEMKPSTRQRFVSLGFSYPDVQVEAEIVAGETGASSETAARLAALATKIRALEHLGLSERPSTRLLVHTARLIDSGLEPRLACRVGLVEPLTDDPEVAGALRDLIQLVF